jgi:hypothetical protein
MLKISHNYRNDAPPVLFNGICFYLFCCIWAALPLPVEGEVAPETCPTKSGWELLARLHSGINFGFSGSSFSHTIQGVGMKAYAHPSSFIGVLRLLGFYNYRRFTNSVRMISLFFLESNHESNLFLTFSIKYDREKIKE